MFVIKLIFVMGCGWGYGNYRNKNDERVLYCCSVYDFYFCIYAMCDFSGGILGWDPVHTTCIPDEMMMRL